MEFQKYKLINNILNSIDFKACTARTIRRKEVLIELHKEIRANGYEIDKCEHEEEIRCIAAPISDIDSKVNAAISISAVKSGMSLEELLKYKDILIEKCNLILKELGYLER